jgi:hypothetical protein
VQLEDVGRDRVKGVDFPIRRGPEIAGGGKQKVSYFHKVTW